MKAPKNVRGVDTPNHNTANSTKVLKSATKEDSSNFNKKFRNINTTIIIPGYIKLTIKVYLIQYTP